MDDTRELCVLMATVALDCGRYSDVIEALRPIFIQKIELTSAERRLLGESFKKISLNLRISMYSIDNMVKKAEEDGDKTHSNLIQNYYQKLEHEFRQHVVNCSHIIIEYLMPYTNNPEAQVHYLLMQINFWTKLSNICRGPEQIYAVSKTEKLCVAAKAIADANLKVTNPVFLELILYYTIFLHEQLGKPYEAASLGRQTYMCVIDCLDQVTEEQYKEIAPLIRHIEETYRHASYFVHDQTDTAIRTIANT